MTNIPRTLIDFIKAQPWSSPGVKLTPLEIVYAEEILEENYWQPGVQWLEFKLQKKDQEASKVAQSFSHAEEQIASMWVFEEIDTREARKRMAVLAPRARW